MNVIAVQDTLYDWASKILTPVDVINISMSENFVASNSVIPVVNGFAMSAVNFDTDNDTTLQLLANRLESHADIATAIISGMAPDMHDIEIYGALGHDVVVNNIIVSGGVSVPALKTNIRSRTASIPAEVMWSEQNGVKSDADTFLIFKLSPFTPVDNDCSSDPEEVATDVIEVIHSRNFEFVLYAQSYGIKAYQVLFNLRDSLSSATGRALLGDIVFVDDFSDVIDLTGLDDSRYEERGALDLRFRIKSTFTDSDGVSVFDGVEYTGKVGKIDVEQK